MIDWFTYLIALLIIVSLIGVFGYFAWKLNQFDSFTDERALNTTDGTSEKKKGHDQNKKKRKEQKKVKRDVKDEETKRENLSKEPSTQTSEETEEESEQVSLLLSFGSTIRLFRFFIDRLGFVISSPNQQSPKTK